jgi:hypothetical protein
MYVKGMPQTNIFQDIFFSNASTDIEGLWPWPGNKRTVNHGIVVPFINRSLSPYAGYYLQNTTISVFPATIITYEFAYSIDLSDIEGFRIRYDSNQDLLVFQVVVTDSSDSTGTYTSSSHASSTGFNYNSSDRGFSTTNPKHIDLDIIPSSKPNMSSLTKIEVIVSSNSAINLRSFVIYAISTLYDQSNYSNILDGFRDNFQSRQPSSGDVGSEDSSSITQDKTMVPSSPTGERILSANGAINNRIAVDYFVPANISSSTITEVSNGLLIYGGNDSSSTFRVDYNIPEIGSDTSKRVNILIPYYTWLGNDDSTYIIRALLLDNRISANTVCKILDTEVKITSGMSYNYIFTEGKINPSGNASILRLEIDNVRKFETFPSSLLWIQYFAMNFRDYNSMCVLEDTHILLANGQWKKVRT